jgi:hypothetical protein
MTGFDFLVINLVLSCIALGLIIYIFLSGKKLYYSMIKILIIFFIISFICVAQEDNITVEEDRPFVPSEGIIDGAKILENETKVIVDYISEDDLWRQSAYWFLYGDMSLANNTNNTNLTA